MKKRGSLKSLILDLFFPKFCFSCKKEGGYLCQDCKSILEISGFHQEFKTENLKDLYFPLEYRNPLLKKLIRSFKYEPFIKELSIPLASLIIDHLQLLDDPPPFYGGGTDFTPHHFLDNQVIHRDKFNRGECPKSGAGFILIPVPLERKKLKWRGFNQAEEIGKEIAKFLKIPLLNDVLMKIKENLAQVELPSELRKENILGVFNCQNQEKIKDRKILLIDDVYTTGSTLEEAARILREAGAKEIIAMVIVRAQPDQDLIKNI